MKFHITPEAKELGINVGVAIFRDANIVNKNGTLEKIKKDVIGKVLEVDTHDNILLKGYKELYAKIGISAIPPAESLIKLIKINGRLPNINTVVDCYNLVSAETLLSIGAHDAAHISGNIIFRATNGHEKYTPLGETHTVKVSKGEYACMDDEKILCRMDIKQCNETKITKNTKEFIIYVQGNRNVSSEYLQSTLERACHLIKEVCGGEYEII